LISQQLAMEREVQQLSVQMTECMTQTQVAAGAAKLQRMRILDAEKVLKARE
jgi:hypothetical protein